MQAGFAMLEVGIVQKKNSTNILFKNMIDASLAAMCFWLLGYGFAYGTDAGGFIGTDNFALSGDYDAPVRACESPGSRTCSTPSSSASTCC